MLDMRQAREDLKALLVGRNELDQHTAEAYAEQARFNYLVSACTVYGETGEPYFKGVDDYLTGDDPTSGRAAHEFGRLYYGLDDDFAKKLPENAFGLKYRLLDDDLRLVDRRGRLVDPRGRLVDKDGRLVNERGELVAADGTPLAEDGSFKVDFVEFEDDLSPAQPDADRAAGVSDAVSPPEAVEAFRGVAEANSKAPGEMTTAA
jgi:hypothetical protein